MELAAGLMDTRLTAGGRRSSCSRAQPDISSINSGTMNRRAPHGAPREENIGIIGPSCPRMIRSKR